MDKLKDSGALAGFKIHKQKIKMLTKNAKRKEKKKLMNKLDFKIEKKVQM